LKINKTTIFAIVIVLLFLGSMFVGVLYRPKDDPINTNQQNADENTTTDYYTSDVDANVISKFSKFIISSPTDEYDVTTIEDNIKKIKGIKTVTSNFNNIDENTIAYLGTLTYTTEYKDDIINSLKEISFFTGLEIYEYALVEIPQEIVFVNSQDKNKTLEYYLPTKKYEAIVSNETLEGDNISANLQAIFKDEELYRLTAIEMQNLSAQPQMVSGSKTYPILEWNKEINIDSKTEFDNNSDINNILDYNYTTTINQNGNLIYNLQNLENISDLNSELQIIKDENNSFIQDFVIDSNQISIQFTEFIDLNSYSNLKTIFLEKYNLDNSKIEEQLKKNIYFKLYEDNIDLNRTKEILNSENINLLDTTKSAIIDINDTNINNVVYNYDQNITTTNIQYPTNKDNLEIEFDVTLYATRNEVMFFMINEKRNEEN